MGPGASSSSRSGSCIGRGGSSKTRWLSAGSAISCCMASTVSFLMMLVLPFRLRNASAGAE